MIPIVALIGRSNVGKSTLFNQLTHTRDALVADVPGLTRDRKYGYAEWKGHKFIVIDTGGIDGIKEGIKTSISKQSLVAIKEANIVLLIVDCHAGLMTADLGIAKYLRRYRKTTIIIANKIDGIDINNVLSDFYPLCMGKIIPIAAIQRRGINKMLKQILLSLVNDTLLMNGTSNKNDFKSYMNKVEGKRVKSKTDKLCNLPQQSVPIKVAIVGRPNVGKSTLINCILGEDRMVVYNVPGTTSDSIYIPIVRGKQEYILTDTAGVRRHCNIMEKLEKFSVDKTMKTIESTDVVLLVIDARENISNQELSLLNFILNNGRALVIAINKWDGLSKNIREEVKKMIDQRLRFISFFRIHFISALYGSGVDSLFKSVNEAYRCAIRRVSTSMLTNIMRKAIDEHQPPLVCGHRVKPKYAHVGGYNPLIVIIHGTKVKNLPNSYKRYLINYFRNSLEIMGIPILIQFKEETNSLSSNCNTLRLTPLYKHNLLVNHVNKNK